MKRNIVLIGFMASGKTAVGAQLAKQLGMKLYCLDTLIVRKAEMSIPRIFDRRGEEGFRKIETSVLKGLVKKKNAVIACGGGVVVKARNIPILRKMGLVVWLKVSPATVLRRVRKMGDRPLLNIKDKAARLQRIKEMLRFRTPLYRVVADQVIDTSKINVKQVAKKIMVFYE